MSNSANANIIIEEARAYGIPEWIPLDIARHESGLNNRAAGDVQNGRATSFGLFQLHEGGKLPAGMTAEQAYDPKTNAHIAIGAMMGAYRKGVAAGLSGFDLEDYVASSSGWPANAGPDWVHKHRPDYTSALRKTFNDNASENYIAAYAGGGQDPQHIDDGTGGAPTDAEIAAQASSGTTHYEDSSHFSTPAATFRSIAKWEQVQTLAEWREQNDKEGTIESLNPVMYLSYAGDNIKQVGVRSMIVLIGLICVVFAIWSVVKQVNPVAQLASGGTPDPLASEAPPAAAEPIPV
jgi:hypothetical protein